MEPGSAAMGIGAVLVGGFSVFSGALKDLHRYVLRKRETSNLKRLGELRFMLSWALEVWLAISTTMDGDEELARLVAKEGLADKMSPAVQEVTAMRTLITKTDSRGLKKVIQQLELILLGGALDELEYGKGTAPRQVSSGLLGTLNKVVDESKAVEQMVQRIDRELIQETLSFIRVSLDKRLQNEGVWRPEQADAPGADASGETEEAYILSPDWVEAAERRLHLVN